MFTDKQSQAYAALWAELGPAERDELRELAVVGGRPSEALFARVKAFESRATFEPVTWWAGDAENATEWQLLHPAFREWMVAEGHT